MDEHPTRRRRRRRTSGGEVGTDPAKPGPVKAVASPPQPPSDERRRERSDRELAGAGHSQIGIQRALRARDVNRPSEADLAEAEDEVVIVRRNWTP